MLLFPFFHCICHFFSYMEVVEFYIFSPSPTPSAYFSNLNGKTHSFFWTVFIALQGWRLFWLNLLFWLFSFSIHFLLCWAIRLHMLFFDPKMLSFTWCIQVSGNLNTALIDIYDRYLRANYLLSGLSILSDTRFCETTISIRILAYICIHFILAPRANLVDLKCLGVFLTYNLILFL